MIGKRFAVSAASAVVLVAGFAMPAAAVSLNDITGRIQTALSGNASAGGVSAGASGTVAVDAGLTTGDGQACTMDARQCPDGSYVGRTGPNCLFAACPGEPDMSTSSTGSTSGSAGVTVGVAGVNTVLMTRNDMGTVATAAIRSASDVTTESDLRAYIATEMASDADVEAVQSSSDTVSITYREPARFLGFLPATLKATATVDATGDVTVHYPWYGFLYAKSSGDIETALEARVRSLIATGGGAAAGTQLAGSGTVTSSTSAGMAADVGVDMMAAEGFTASTQAEIISEMRAAMEGVVTASASTSGR